MKFIPTWKKVVVKKPFYGFKEFRRRMTNKMFFEEKEPGVFVRNKNFHIKNKNFWADENFKEIDDFCFRLRDGITNIIENVNIDAAENMSKKEFSALQNVVEAKNENQIINDPDKNLGAVMADKEAVIIE